MKRHLGFTLIELMIVVAIIAVIAANALPGLMRSRMAANETSAVAACKAYAEGQEIYHRIEYDKEGVLEYSQKMSGDNSLLETTTGARSYMMGTNMVSGYGLSAVCGTYEGTGRNTYIIDQHGTIFRADRATGSTLHRTELNPALARLYACGIIC
ncbi:MAG TPA: DUF2950 family protein [Planctomycetota bacterium]|nr:DUF2950 family protein [Planctomycetota bacterium]